MQDLEVRLIECVVHCYCCPGVNEFRHRTAPLQRAPPAGSTRKLHLHQQQVVLQRDGHRGRTEGCGERGKQELLMIDVMTSYTRTCFTLKIIEFS